MNEVAAALPDRQVPERVGLRIRRQGKQRLSTDLRLLLIIPESLRSLCYTFQSSGRCMMNKSSLLGFTLIELMVTVSVAAILLTVGVPSFREVIRSNRLSTCANEFVATLNLARSEAIKRGMRVSVRKTGSSWESGWEVFSDDKKGSGNYGIKDGSDETIRLSGSLPAGYTLRPNTNSFTNFISFKPSGQSTSFGSFVLCDNLDGNGIPEPYTARLIVVDSVGRVRLGADSDKDGIPEDQAGKEIPSCTAP